LGFPVATIPCLHVFQEYITSFLAVHTWILPFFQSVRLPCNCTGQSNIINENLVNTKLFLVRSLMHGNLTSVTSSASGLAKLGLSWKDSL